MNINIIIVDAVFTSASTEIAMIITSMKNPVMSIAMCGVLNLPLVLDITPGSSPSLLMAIGVRLAANIPALPVVANAISAAKLMMIPPALPIIASPPKTIGVREPARDSLCTIPTVTNVTAM